MTITRSETVYNAIGVHAAALQPGDRVHTAPDNTEIDLIRTVARTEREGRKVVVFLTASYGPAGGELWDRVLPDRVMLVHRDVDHLAEVRTATDQLAALRAAADVADEAWRAAIQAAVRAGQRVVDVADAAGGISRERVYQIRDGRR